MKVPAVVGLVKINSVQKSGMFQAGDAFWFSPDNESIIFAGPGSYNVGDGLRTKTKIDIHFNNVLSK